MVVATRQGLICSPIADVIDQRLVLDMPFGEGKGTFTKDLSGKGNHGTLKGGVSWKLLPSGIWVLSFDGSTGYTAIPSFTVPADYLTIEVWILPAVDFQADATKWYFAECINSGGCNFLYNNTGKIHCNWRAGNAWVGPVEYTTTLVKDTWYHIVYRLNGVSDAKIFVNGDEKASVSPNTAVGSITHELVIGATNTYGNKMNGLIALPRIYNRALSAGEIKNRYNQTKHLFGK